MKRYLLFDGGCTLCTGLARAIEQATDGWLTAKSLRDPEMQALLNRARPGWTWEPTLVEVHGERVHSYTGIKMRARLAMGLGPRRALRVAQLVQQALSPKVAIDQGRRTFLQRGALLAGLLVVGPRLSETSSPLSKLVPTVSASPRGSSSVTEAQQAVSLETKGVNPRCFSPGI